MLSDQQRAIVKTTVPALEAHGETITRRFYSALLIAHPELLNYFNPTNQLGEGGQARSLAASVLTYAKNIDQLETLGGMVERITAKHVSLEIRPEHYPVVGEYLLRRRSPRGRRDARYNRRVGCRLRPVGEHHDRARGGCEKGGLRTAWRVGRLQAIPSCPQWAPRTEPTPP